MSFRSSETLQFDELKELVATYAGSVAGKQRILDCDTQRERALVESEHAEAGEAIAYLSEASAPQRAGHGSAVRLQFHQVRHVENLPLLRVQGARLDGREILDLFHTLAIAGEYRALLLGVSSKFPRLAGRARRTGGPAKPFLSVISAYFFPTAASLTMQASLCGGFAARLNVNGRAFRNLWSDF